MSSETKSRAGRTAEQVVNEWRESGSQDWGQLVSAINYWAVTDMCPALESSSSADTGGREAHLTQEQVKEIIAPYINLFQFRDCFEIVTDRINAALREPGADTGTTPLHEAAIDLLNHIENILDDENFDKIDSKLWNRVTGLAAADPGTTGAEGLERGAFAAGLRRAAQEADEEQIEYESNLPANDTSRSRLMDLHGALACKAVAKRIRTLAATQRAVTPPAHTAFVARRWVEMMRGANETSQIASLIELLKVEAAPAPVTTPGRDEALTTAILARKLNASGHSNASFAHGYTTACDDILKALLAAKEPRG